jgi:hypothetical protein
LKKPFRHRAAHSFWKLYGNLPEDIRNPADENFTLLKADPRHPSLRFRHLKDDMWSARVGMHFRAIALEEDGGFAWIWIGSHAEYDRLIR